MTRIDSAAAPAVSPARNGFKGSASASEFDLTSAPTLSAPPPGCFWTTNRDLFITRAEGTELPKAGPEEWVGRLLDDVFPGESRLSVVAAHRAALGGQSSPFEFRKQSRIFQGRAEPIYDCFENLIGTAALAVDVTERCLAEKRALQAREAKNVQALKRFAGGVAHNFNNLLTVILGYVHLAKSEVSDKGRYLREIESAAQCLADLTGAIASFGNKHHHVFKPISLTALVESAKEAIHLLVPAHIEVRYELSEVPGRIEGDLEQLRRVLMVLVANASEAIGGTAGTIRVSTDVVYADRMFLAGLRGANETPEGKYVRLRVSDSGIGIDEDSREHLLEPFYSTKFTGRGMGLAAAQGIVTAHGGTLAFAGVPGLGTTFHVLFPCQNPAGAGQSVPG